MYTDSYIQFARIGTTEVIVILLIVLLLFGARKIPDLMKGLGKGIKEYKKAVKGVEDELLGDETSDETKTEPKD